MSLLSIMLSVFINTIRVYFSGMSNDGTMELDENKLWGPNPVHPCKIKAIG